MNILGGGGGRGEIYANALIEKEKDDLTEGDQGESRGDTMKKKVMLSGPATDVAYSPDGKYLVSSDANRKGMYT